MNIIDNTPTPPPGPIFDKDAVYESELRPLVDQIAAICRREGLPAILTICVARDPEGGVTHRDTIISGSEKYLPSKFFATAMVLRSEGMQMGSVSVIAQKPEGGLPA